MKMSSEFHTEWGLNWAKNVKDFSELAEATAYVNLRPNVYEAQRQFETHLSEIMNYGTHQPLY